MKKLTTKQLNKLYYTDKLRWIKEKEKQNPDLMHIGVFNGDWIIRPNKKKSNLPTK